MYGYVISGVHSEHMRMGIGLYCKAIEMTKLDFNTMTRLDERLTHRYPLEKSLAFHCI